MLQEFNEKNRNLKVYINGEILERAEAKISVFDSVVQGGDAVWEGLRLYKEGIFLLDRHLERLLDSAHAMAFTKVPSKQEIISALAQTIEANQMKEGVHIRLTLTRGEKITSGMDPRLNQSGPCLIILPEYKAPVYDNKHGISVVTSTIRRNAPMYVDSKIHHNNLINNILAKIQANVAGVDAALMLDQAGFAAELNGTNLFMVRNKVVYTPFATACLHGITRGFVLDLCQKLKIKHQEKNLSLTELYTSDQLFCTGTMGELTPIHILDGRSIENKSNNNILEQLVASFNDSIATYCIPLT